MRGGTSQLSWDIELCFAKQQEGKLFEHLWLLRLGDEWIVNLDYYTVQQGQVMIVYADGKLQATGDSNSTLHKECVMVGDYDPAKQYQRQQRFVEYGRLKELLHIEEA